MRELYHTHAGFMSNSAVYKGPPRGSIVEVAADGADLRQAASGVGVLQGWIAQIANKHA